MRCLRVLLPLLLLTPGMLVPAVAAPLPGQTAANGLPTLAPMVEEVVPGVVNINTRTRIQTRQSPLLNDPFFRRFFDLPQVPREREAQSLGSGVIVDAEQGFVLTNQHVIKEADEITVTLRDGRSFDASVVGTDPETDLAVIQIDADNLMAVPMADSDDLRVGDYVVAIGNPFGLGQTVTSGIVSAVGRSGLGIEGYEDFIQTDASINPGNSGGALVNLEGELVGINTAIIGPSGGNIGIGFAIPSNMARGVMQQLIEHGEVRRGQLGVFIQDLTTELAEAMGLDSSDGALVTQVVEDSAAAKAGLQPGDVVVAVNGQAIESAGELRNKVGLMPVGQDVRLTVIRDGKKREVTTQLVQETREDLAGQRLNQRLSGATFAPIAEDHPLRGEVQGVMVSSVESGSAAAQAGLREGDVITSVNRRAVSDLDTFAQMVRAVQGKLLLNIRRGGGAFFLLIQ